MYKVAIVGRPNVGKSSLFNVLLSERKAITDSISGTTIDLNYGEITWFGKIFSLIDTGGITFENASFENEIKKQVDFAISNSDLILFLVDVNQGITKDDLLIKNKLLKSKKEVILVCNKVDNENKLLNSYEFYALGFDKLIQISTLHKINLGDLKDLIVKNIKNQSNKEDDDLIKFAIVGRPNVGKSSLANQIIGFDRSVVSNIKGTTRDSIDTKIKNNNNNYLIIDTAGILKRGKLDTDLIKFSQMRAIESIKKSDVCILVLDATSPFTELDQNIAGYIKENNKAVVVVVNKIDLIMHNELEILELTKKIKKHYQMFNDFEVLFMSALEHKKIEKLFSFIKNTYDNYSLKFKTNILNDILAKAITINPAKQFNNGTARFKYITQIKNKPPTFNLYVNNEKYVHFSYLRYLENEFRNSLNLKGTPIVFNLCEGEKNE